MGTNRDFPSEVIRRNKKVEKRKCSLHAPMLPNAKSPNHLRLSQVPLKITSVLTHLGKHCSRHLIYVSRNLYEMKCVLCDVA